MEINERISMCLSSLESKQKSVDTFQARLRQMLDSLRKGGVTDGGVVELLQTMDAVVKDYAEISLSCRQMVEGLREISDHLQRVDEGRRKILTGVETILQNLSNLDRLTRGGIQVGTSAAGSPRKILLVRLNPENIQPRAESEDEEDEGPAGDSVVH